MDPRWVQWNRALRGAREKRIRPHLDDKILTSWNALLIVAYAKASRAFALPHLADSAARVFTFLQSQLTDDTGRILARYRDGEAKYPGYVDDYAFLIWGAIELYEATFHPQYLQFAIQWQHEMIRLFWDEEHDGFYYSGSDAETLVARPKELYDGAMPSGNSVAALNLVRLARLTGDPVWERRAQAQLEAFVEQVGSYPSGFTFYLMALQYATGQSRELVMVGALGELQSAIQQVGQRFAPNEVTVVVEPGQEGEPIHSLCPAVAAFTMLDQRPTFYTCENYACERPTTDVETWLEALG